MDPAVQFSESSNITVIEEFPDTAIMQAVVVTSASRDAIALSRRLTSAFAQLGAIGVAPVERGVA